MEINIHNASFAYCAGTAAQLPKTTIPEILFSGRSNVGKSSLINKLLNRNGLARTSAQPGKTATINFYNIDDKLYFADLPGYGFAKTGECDKARWKQLVDGYLTGSRNIALAIQLIDFRRTATAEDLTMLKYFQTEHIPTLAVYTKSDKLNQTEFDKRTSAIPTELPNGTPFIVYSKMSGTGVQEIWERVSCVYLDKE
ncbi:MAG: ribosome biogenesis GTP-binding protein YihA/YsxC [Oscillospiraceae bacterium]|jgi:GTP-binding protein|nr:ribosome biogenesis GTP-binding protein YihA/YsxC [Oscillospiraceae bacterium]